MFGARCQKFMLAVQMQGERLHHNQLGYRKHAFLAGMRCKLYTVGACVCVWVHGDAGMLGALGGGVIL